MKGSICTMLGAIGGTIAALFGGWDAALVTLVIFMIIDYITGVIVAAIFHASNKSENGALKSSAGWKGLCKKGVTLLIVLVAHCLDWVMGINFIRETVIIGFIANEGISITENAVLMGIPMPTIIKKMLEVLKKSNEEKAQGELNDASKNIQNK